MLGITKKKIVVRAPRTGVRDGCGWYYHNPCHVQEQKVLLITERLLDPLKLETLYKFNFCFSEE